MVINNQRRVRSVCLYAYTKSWSLILRATQACLADVFSAQLVRSRLDSELPTVPEPEPEPRSKRQETKTHCVALFKPEKPGNHERDEEQS
jgi:hypothetical protein